MKFNPECVRSVLLAVEKMDYNQCISPTELSGILSDYTVNEIDYTCLKLYEADFISAELSDTRLTNIPQVLNIFDITYKGHEFLNSIRGEEIWDKVKKFGKKSGAFSLEIAKDLAVSLASSLALQFFKD